MLTQRKASHSYIEGCRYHVTPLGQLPGVTTILSATSEFNFKQWRQDNPEESKRCLNRGLLLHDHVEFYFSNDWTHSLKEESPLFIKLYNGVLRYIKPVVTEHQVYSKLGYSGSLDCLGYWNDKLTLFDWKTSTNRKTSSQITSYLMQVAAYAYALKELDDITVDQTAVVVIPEESDCQVFKMDNRLTSIYFDEFKRRLKWFHNMAIAS